MAAEPRAVNEVDHPVVQDRQRTLQQCTAVGMPLCLARKLWASTYMLKQSMISSIGDIMEANRQD